ncbi:MAG TPA: glycosyltransferase family 1 protein [Ktedonobacterales bacterium]
MRIAIDYTPATVSRHGIGRYTRSLVEAVLRLDGTDEIVLFSAERPHESDALPAGPNVCTRVFPVGQRVMTILWDRARVPLPLELLVGGADVVHGPAFAPPPSLSMRRIATVHDVAYLTIPDFIAPKFVAYQQSLLPRTIKRMDHVITDSQCTAEDVISLLGVPREKVTAIPLGVDASFARVRDEECLTAFDAQHGLTHPLVLAVGIMERRKRYDALVRAFAAARTAEGGPKMLAIAGSKGWGAEETLQAVRECGAEDAVKFLDYVPDADLATLYSTADVLAMPARYEGFGLPVVEAMACGTPVVCSGTGSLPEVVGDAGLVVDVQVEGALADALVRATSDAALRETLARRGVERAATFTWERTARQTLEVYRDVGGRSRHNGNA